MDCDAIITKTSVLEKDFMFDNDWINLEHLETTSSLVSAHNSFEQIIIASILIGSFAALLGVDAINSA